MCDVVLAICKVTQHVRERRGAGASGQKKGPLTTTTPMELREVHNELIKCPSFLDAVSCIDRARGESLFAWKQLVLLGTRVACVRHGEPA